MNPKSGSSQDGDVKCFYYFTTHTKDSTELCWNLQLCIILEINSTISSALHANECEEKKYLDAVEGGFLSYKHEAVLSSAENSPEDNADERIAADQPEEDGGIWPW